jgi:hypothetical protein
MPESVLLSAQSWRFRNATLNKTLSCLNVPGFPLTALYRVVSLDASPKATIDFSVSPPLRFQGAVLSGFRRLTAI